ncbi:MAG: tetratricopeptide repeat protein [Burkholderiales bacterium]|nr:tetratricopeptide repeat protein [Burkholderiales bacterium]
MASGAIANLEKLRGTARDGALLRYSLGAEYLKAGEVEAAVRELQEAVARDPGYSAAWKLLGRALEQAGRDRAALEAWGRGIEAARARGDRQAEKEMAVFAKRLQRRLAP